MSGTDDGGVVCLETDVLHPSALQTVTRVPQCCQPVVIYDFFRVVGAASVSHVPTVLIFTHISPGQYASLLQQCSHDQRV